MKTNSTENIFHRQLTSIKQLINCTKPKRGAQERCVFSGRFTESKSNIKATWKNGCSKKRKKKKKSSTQFPSAFTDGSFSFTDPLDLLVGSVISFQECISYQKNS